MSETPAATPTPPRPTGQLSAGQRSLSCIGRLLSAVLVIVITTVITLAVGAYAALYLGYTPQTPGALGDAQARVTTLESENAALRTQAVAVQTQLSQMSRQAGTDREELDALKEEVSAFAQISDEVATRLTADSRERATQVADMRGSRDAVVQFATAEADRVAMIEDLRRRSERIERFLARLSDIAGDAALDLGAGDMTPTPTAAPSPTPVSEETPTPTPAPTEEPTASPVPASPSPTTRPTASPTRPASPTAEPSETPTPAPGR